MLTTFHRRLDVPDESKLVNQPPQWVPSQCDQDGSVARPGPKAADRARAVVDDRGNRGVVKWGSRGGQAHPMTEGAGGVWLIEWLGLGVE